ncbi:unnamed protein product, partial [Cylicostephanus goldi]
DTSRRCYVRQARTKGVYGDCRWEYVPLNKKGSDGKDLYALHINPLEGKDSGTLGDWAENASVNATPPWREPFCREYYTHTTMLVINKPVKVLTCVEMFKDFELLQEANIPGLDASSAKSMTGMFKGTPSLKKLCIKSTFRIAEDAGLDEAGTRAGTHWARKANREDGAEVDQDKQVFESVRALADFHNEKTKRSSDVNTESYLRITPKLVVTFDKGADDVRGTMDPQQFSYGEEKALTKNAYQRDGHAFVGWEDVAGNSYADEELFKNTYPDEDKSIVLTTQWEAHNSSTISDVSGPGTEKVSDKVCEGEGGNQLEGEQCHQDGLVSELTKLQGSTLLANHEPVLSDPAISTLEGPAGRAEQLEPVVSEEPELQNIGLGEPNRGDLPDVPVQATKPEQPVDQATQSE